MIIRGRQADGNTVKKGEVNTMVNRGPITEVAHREKECNPHFFGEVGVLTGEVATGLMGKQQILGKTRGKTRGKIIDEVLGKTLYNLGGVIIVTTQPGVRGGLVLPGMCLVSPVQKWDISRTNVGAFKINDIFPLVTRILARQVNIKMKV